jgi:RNA polymerase sigma-70 factor (ECF subfamily)
MLEDSPNPIPPPTRSLNSDSEAVSPLSASTPDDFALLSRVRSGDQGAMADLFDRYSGVLYSVALRVLKDPGQAEDIMQDIFIQVWRKPDSFASGRGSLGGWLAVVTRNRAIDLLRKRRPSDSVEDVVLVSKTNTASEAERNVLMEKVRVVMADLPPDQKTSVELAYFDGMSHTEIAEKTGEPLGTVKTRIRLAMITLRKALGT